MQRKVDGSGRINNEPTDNYAIDVGEGSDESSENNNQSPPFSPAPSPCVSPEPKMDEPGVVSGYRGNSWVYENKLGVAEDLQYLSHMPELCDVTFLVGENKDPVCAVRAILAARSRIFHKLLYSAARTTPRKKPTSSSDKLGRRVTQMIRRSSIDLGDDCSNSLAFPRSVVVEEFEPQVFRQLIQYCHTGCATLKPRTVLGLMNAADHYGLDELRRSCTSYLQECLSVDTVCLLLRSAERYIQYKSTKSLVQKALDFVEMNAESVLKLPAFTSLPNHVVRLILSRDELQADELTKFHAALAWSRSYMEKHPDSNLKEVMTPFVESIQFHLIPATTLMQTVKPTGVIPDQQIMTALAYQADPSSVKPGSLSTTPARLRLSLLSLNLQDSPTLSKPSMRSDNSTSSLKSLNTSQQELDKLSLDNEQNSDKETNSLSETIRDYSHDSSDTEKEVCHINNNSNNRRDQYLTNNHEKENGFVDDKEVVSNHENVHVTFRPEPSFSPPCLSDTSMSCSLSTCSDWTDTSSSAGGSFGRADQKECNFKLLLPE